MFNTMIIYYNMKIGEALIRLSLQLHLDDQIADNTSTLLITGRSVGENAQWEIKDSHWRTHNPSRFIWETNNNSWEYHTLLLSDRSTS